MNRRNFILDFAATAVLGSRAVRSRVLAANSRLRAGPIRAGEPADLAKFATLHSWIAPEMTPLLQKQWDEGMPLSVSSKGSESDVGIAWAEFRKVDKVILRFAGIERQPAAGELSLEYWEGLTVLQGRWREVQDDFVGGELPLLGVQPEGGQATWTYSFSPRRTAKLRCHFRSPQLVQIAGFQAYGSSHMELGEVRIEWISSRGPHDCDGTLEIYNGYVIQVQAFGATHMTGKTSWRSSSSAGGARGITVRVAYTAGDAIDRTVLTLRTRSGSFSFLPREVIESEPIEMPDFGVYITNHAASLDYSAYKRQNTARRRIIDLVPALREQSLEGAYRNIRAKRVPLTFVGVDSHRQKFGIAPDGHLVVGNNDPSRGNPILPRFAFYFSSGASPAPFADSSVRPNVVFDPAAGKRQDLEGGWLPIVRTCWSENDVSFERTDLAASLEPMEGSQGVGNVPSFLVSRLEIRNTSVIPQTVWYLMKPWKPAKGEVGYETLPSGVENSWGVELRENQIVVSDGSEELLVGQINIQGLGTVELDPALGAVRYAVHTNPFEKHTIHILIPGQPLPFSAEKRLPELLFDQVHSATSKYWKERLAEGMEILVPDERLQNLYKASLPHFLLAMTEDVKRGECYPNAATFHYGSIGSESAPVIHALDLRGMHDRARSCLQAWLSTQSDTQPDGDYASKEGGFYHFWPIYTVDQGGILWALAEHYLLTRDADWLRMAAPHIIKGCDFILRERNRILSKPRGETEDAYRGLAPAGTVFDMRDWTQTFMLNGWLYFGLKRCAQALAAVDPENSTRIARGAADYQRDLRQALKKSVVLSPAVRLRDNTSVPSVPPHPGMRGFRSDVEDIPDVGYGQGYIYDVEGGPLHLVNTEVLDPLELEVKWMLAYLEDRFFTYSPPGPSVIDLSNLSEDWFNLGGFPKLQPYYLHYAETYLLRDEIPNFIRAFYNTLAAIADPQTLCFYESLRGGEPNKTHEEAWFFHQLRSMLVMEIGQDLFLARGTPRAWLEDNKQIAVSKAPTHFGKVGYSIHSWADKGRIEAEVMPPDDLNRGNLYIRFRHPEQASIREVRVNGEQWTDFNPAKEWIRLPKTKGSLKVLALY